MKPASSIGWRAAAAALIALGLARSAAAQTITVTHWGAAFYGAPYAVAMAKGFFKQRGVDITGVLTSTGGGTSVPVCHWVELLAQRLQASVADG